MKKKLVFLMSLTLALFSVSCDDQWDDDNVEGTKSQTLWEVISATPELSEFTAALTAGGYDALLQSSGAYTVLAPVNNAMSQVPDSILDQVPGSHIALLEYNKSTLDTMTYLSVYNGKLVVLDSLKIQPQEVVCRNGILRYTNYASGRQPNIFELLDGLKEKNDMAAFILSLGDSVFDVENSVQLGVDPETNLPIYDTVYKYFNPLLTDMPINNNDSLLSLVLVDNPTFEALAAKYWPFFKQHNGLNRDPYYTSDFKVDSAATDSVVRVELVKDLTCYLEGTSGTTEYQSMKGLKLSYPTVDSVIQASNGNIVCLSALKIRIKDNKVNDLIVEGEDYYDTNENYVFTRVVPSASGSRDVVLCGVDTMRSYYAYYVDSLGNMTDSVYFKTVSTNYGYVGTSFASNSNPQLNYAKGGSYLAYKAPLFSCRYKIFWRSVDDRPHHANADTTCVDYDKWLANPNYPCGGVIRNTQKMYLSQPGDFELEYNNAEGEGDFVLNATANNIFNSTYKNFKCLAGYDPDADLKTEVTATGNFARLGSNAGYGVDDYSWETPLIWCKTAQVNMGKAEPAVYYSGIVDVSTNENLRFNNKGRPTSVPKDIFLCFYHGDATVFVTNAPFNQTNNTTPAANKVQPHGSIYLDYIRFVPDLDEDVDADFDE